MKNVTVTLEDSVADWARVWAAKRRTSVSRILGELLTEKMAVEERYSAAMEEFLAVRPTPLSSKDAASPYPTRDQAHDR